MGASVLRHRSATAHLVPGRLRQRLHALSAGQRSEYDVHSGGNHHGFFSAQLRRFWIRWRRRSWRRFRRWRRRRLLGRIETAVIYVSSFTRLLSEVAFTLLRNRK